MCRDKYGRPCMQHMSEVILNLCVVFNELRKQGSKVQYHHISDEARLLCTGCRGCGAREKKKMLTLGNRAPSLSEILYAVILGWRTNLSRG